MVKLMYLLVIASIFIQNILAQNGYYELGARSQGVGNSSVTFIDGNAIFNNIGAISKLETTSLHASYLVLPGLAGIGIASLGLVWPFKPFNLAIGAARLGNNIYNEHRLSLGAGNQFGHTGLGLQVNYFQFSFEGLGSRQVVVLEFGGVTEITPEFFFGAHIYNLNQAKISRATGEPIPTLIKAGLSYHPHDRLLVGIEVEKDIDFEPNLKFGLEYKPIQMASFRTGLNSRPARYFFGFGLEVNPFELDYGISHHPSLGNSHQLSISYQLSKS